MWLVKLGIWDVKSVTEKNQVMEIEKVFVHPKWNRADYALGNDIAMIKLKGQINFTDPFVGVPCPPDVTKDYRGESHCIISGWGTTKFKHGMPVKPALLQKAEGRIWRREEVDNAGFPFPLGGLWWTFGL